MNPAYKEGTVGELAPCYELCFGENHEPSDTWVVVARLAFENNVGVLEYSAGITAEQRRWAEREVRYTMAYDYMGTQIQRIVGRALIPDYASRYDAITRSAGNWCGQWHWRRCR